MGTQTCVYKDPSYISQQRRRGRQVVSFLLSRNHLLTVPLSRQKGDLGTVSTSPPSAALCKMLRSTLKELLMELVCRPTRLAVAFFFPILNGRSYRPTGLVDRKRTQSVRR
jgi:hypothetical protein